MDNNKLWQFTAQYFSLSRNTQEEVVDELLLKI